MPRGVIHFLEKEEILIEKFSLGSQFHSDCLSPFYIEHQRLFINYSRMLSLSRSESHSKIYGFYF